MKMKRKLSNLGRHTIKWIMLLFLMVTATSWGQDSFVVANVTLFDGEEVKTKVWVEVTDGFIQEVSQTPITDVKDIVDGTDKFLMPALTNAHVHAWAPASLKEGAGAGVLNLMDMMGFESFQGAMKQYKDSTDYASYYVSGFAATAPEGHGTQFGFPVPTLTKPEEASQFIKDRKAAGADYIKIIIEPWKPTLNKETIKALIDAAKENDLMAVAHVSKLEDGIFAIENGIDGLVHMWGDKQISPQELQQITKQKDFFITPTMLTSTLAAVQRRTKDSLADVWTSVKRGNELKKLYDAGIPILSGTDPPNFGINYGKDLYKELQLFAEAGIPNIDVLKSSTSLAAKYFKLKNKGFIKAGYRADMLLIDGDPIKEISDISKIERIWKLGKQLSLQQ